MCMCEEVDMILYSQTVTITNKFLINQTFRQQSVFVSVKTLKVFTLTKTLCCRNVWFIRNVFVIVIVTFKLLKFSH